MAAEAGSSQFFMTNMSVLLLGTPHHSCGGISGVMVKSTERRTSAPDQSYSQDMLLHDQRSLTSAVSTVLSLHRRRCGKVPAAPYVLGHSLATPCKARTSRDTGKETPRGSPAKPPPPWSQSLAETYLRRITWLQRNVPVGGGAASRDTLRPMPGVRALGSWLLGDPPAVWVYPGRFGPRRIREESVMLRTTNPSTGALPFQTLSVADLGDVNVNLYNLQDSCRLIREAYQKIVAAGCIPLTLGGDHTITYPILQAMAKKHGPVGLLHVDAHTDTADKALGEKVYHGTPFRRCVDEGLLDRKRVVQIGIRGSAMTLDPYRYSWSQVTNQTPLPLSPVCKVPFCPVPPQW
ncbi:mitochondrial [Lynx pardinus]|uniref:Mitochondrial n=1 Tax=Lynx pardinus TaxID=191816 RepID=A0A485PCP1_LYNPA|nr:mitochondrial [Lynx pardinus]